MKPALRYPVFLLTLGLLLCLLACEDMIRVAPPRAQLVSSTVFEDEVTATAAVLGLYMEIPTGGYASIGYLGGLSSDELSVEQDNEQLQFYGNRIFSSNRNISTLWGNGYSRISKANAVIEGLQKSKSLASGLRDQLRGEAVFMRAFTYFYLVNLFGDVPYITTTDYGANATAGRTSVSDIYAHLEEELLLAKTLLKDDYANFNNERARVNKWAATALLARLYLYNQKWDQAKEQATIIINKKGLYTLNSKENIDQVFLKNGPESIWQVAPQGGQNSTQEANLFVRSDYDPTIALITDELYHAFEDGDARQAIWIDRRDYGGYTWYRPFKYKETTTTSTDAEYYTVFRLAEQYLIRAEARAQLNETNDALSDLNVIRDRAGLTPLAGLSGADLLLAIEQERRVELFLEWGHRWMDLKRTGRLSEVLTPVKGAWQEEYALYPLPFSEVQLDRHLTQNFGY